MFFVPPNPHFPPQDFNQQRRKKTPSQLRREERRRKKRDSKNVEAEVEVVEASKEAENIIDNEQEYSENGQTYKVADVDATVVNDEVCPDHVYHEKEIDPSEAARDKIVEKIIIYPVSKKWKIEKDVIENEIKDKLKLIEMSVKRIETKRTIFGEFNGSIVEISPVNVNKVWGRRLGMTNCAITSFDPYVCFTTPIIFRVEV